MVILYRETSIVKVAIASVSENLFFFLEGRKIDQYELENANVI